MVPAGLRHRGRAAPSSPLAYKDREDLTAGYAQDVFDPADAATHPSQESPVRVAYALRWLELFDDATAPSWPALVG